MRTYIIALKYPSGYVYRAKLMAIDFDDAVVEAKSRRNMREVQSFSDVVREKPGHHPIRIWSVEETKEKTQ